VALVTESTKTFLFRTFGFVSVKSHFLEQVRDFEEEREDVHVRSILEDAKKRPGILMDSRSFGLPESWKS